MLWASLTVLLKASLCTIGDIKELSKYAQIEPEDNTILSQIHDKIVKCILLTKCYLMLFTLELYCTNLI